MSGPPITIALLPERNVFDQKKRYKPLQEYLSTAIGQPVVFKLLDNYQVILPNSQHRVEGRFRQHERAIARSRAASDSGAAGGAQRGLDLHRRNLCQGRQASPRIEDGRASALLVNKATTAGYLYPLSLLRLSGYAGDPERYFARMIFAGSHDAAILAVFNGEADFGACKNTV
jgi:phosphonate transport system substrate-binding protein